MTVGVGGQEAAGVLAQMSDQTQHCQPIANSEYLSRLQQAQSLMKTHDLQAMWLNAGTQLRYFTGTSWHASERLVGAILTQQGELFYVAPTFELGTLEGYLGVSGPIHTWQEHESPYVLVANLLADHGIHEGRIGMDESAAFFVADGFAKAMPRLRVSSAQAVTAGCRMQKSPAELALMQCAKNITLQVQKAAASILHEGITTTEVVSFIDRAHRAFGVSSGSVFCIVLFGEATAYPHGVKYPQSLKRGDMVLIDTGCQVQGYLSDITRSYVFGAPSQRQRDIWQLEKAAQQAAFDAAKIGVPCAAVDAAARTVLEAGGLGPDYQLPGLPHRTGHGIGLDIHEWPYLVRGDNTPLSEGMCFSNEPMICVPGEFGVRLEDHFYMTADGARWFTNPAYSIDDPFALVK